MDSHQSEIWACLYTMQEFCYLNGNTLIQRYVSSSILLKRVQKFYMSWYIASTQLKKKHYFFSPFLNKKVLMGFASAAFTCTMKRTLYLCYEKHSGLSYVPGHLWWIWHNVWKLWRVQCNFKTSKVMWSEMMLPSIRRLGCSCMSWFPQQHKDPIPRLIKSSTL